MIAELVLSRMPVPGYDPDDVDDMLESRLEESDIRDRLSETEWQSYQDGDGNLSDLLDDEEITGMLDD
jgi:hypothetical protein